MSALEHFMVAILGCGQGGIGELGQGGWIRRSAGHCQATDFSDLVKSKRTDPTLRFGSVKMENGTSSTAKRPTGCADRAEAGAPEARAGAKVCFIIDSDPHIREAVTDLVAALGIRPIAFASAAELGISEITYQIHRSNVMLKMKAASLADLVRMAEKLRIPVTHSRRPRPSRSDKCFLEVAHLDS